MTTIISKKYVKIAFSLLFTMLIGCQATNTNDLNSSTPSSTINLSFWTPFTGGDEAFMSELVNQYNNENNDHVQIDLRHYKSEEYYNALVTSIVTENAPDIAIVHSSKYAQFMPAKFFKEIDSLAAEAEVNWNDFNENILSSTMIGDSHFGIPLDTHFIVMYYNKDLLQQVGLLDENEMPIINAGEDGYLQFLQSLKTKLPSNIAPLSIPDSRVDIYWLWWSLYNQMNNSGMIDFPSLESNMDDTSALKALQFIQSIKNHDYLSTNVENHLSHFSEGKSATLIWGIWSVGLIEQADNLNFGIIPIPLIYDQPAVWGDSHTFAFPLQEIEDTTKSIAAVKFANWIANHGEGWAQAGHVPASKSVVQSDSYLALPYRSIYSPTANDVKYLPNHPRMTKIKDSMIKELELMISGRKLPDQTLEQFHQIIKQYMEEPE